ncbi:MAG: amidohydrolase [Candidatus Bathycorpusculaceae bacterium]
MEKADILIQGCLILPMSRQGLIEGGGIAIKDQKITFVGKSSAAANMASETKLDARGMVAIPGLINCHTHVPMTLFRGLAEDQPLNAWLEKTIWPLEAKLKGDDIYAGALLGCLEMIKSGTTCFADMYFHEDMVAKAVGESGLRGVLAEGIIGVKKAQGENMLKTSVSFAKTFHGHANGRITAFLGPHAAYTCSPELLEKIRESASELKIGVHIHLAESKEMFRRLGNKRGSTEVEFLERIGFLEGHTLAAHCVYLSEKDRRILSARRVHVAHNPVANAKLGLGIAQVRELLDLGVNVGLGTDGPANNNTLDMFETMKFAALLQKNLRADPKALSACETLKMATTNAAKALKLENVGALEVGKKADIILLDISKPHLRPLHNIYANLVYSTRGSDVDTVIVDGKIVMAHRQVKTLDEQAIMEKAEKAASSLG